LRRYLDRYLPELFVFFAEDVWAQVKEFEGINALELESQLANLADLLVVIVESPGTFAELGAFAASDGLRHKLLPILDSRYRGEPSFINSGPVEWVKKDSRFGPPIYCNLDALLLEGDEVVNRARLIPGRGQVPLIEQVDPAKKPKHLLFLLCDLVAIVGPVNETRCRSLLAELVGPTPVWGIHSLLALATTLGLLQSFDCDGGKYYFRPLEAGALRAFQAESVQTIAEMRAEYVSALLSLKEGRTLLDCMAKALKGRSDDAA